MSLELKRFLLNAYRSFIGRDTAVNKGSHFFRIDDTKEADKYPVFCHICVRVTGLDRFRLDMNNLPMHYEIEALVKSKGGEVRAENSLCHVSLTLNASDLDTVLTLSKIIRDIVAPNQAHSDTDHERICLHTADSLDRFANLMKQYEKQTAGIEKTRPDGLFAF